MQRTSKYESLVFNLLPWILGFLVNLCLFYKHQCNHYIVSQMQGDHDFRDFFSFKFVKKSTSLRHKPRQRMELKLWDLLIVLPSNSGTQTGDRFTTYAPELEYRKCAYKSFPQKKNQVIRR